MDNLCQVEAVSSGTIDIGFVRTPLNVEGLTCKQIYSESFSLVISENHPLVKANHVNLESLKHDPFIGFPKNCAPAMHDSVVSIFSKSGFFPEIIHESQQINSILRLVESNLGYSIVPSSVKQGYKLGVRYFELDYLSEKTSVSLIYNPANKNALAENIVFLILNTPL
jgi:DNA-binding transcriptional LysR family regulator